MTPPSRPIVEADLHAFVDGQMGFERRATVVQAMVSDPELRGRVEQWRRQNEALTATFGGVVGEPVPLRLMPTNFSPPKAPVAEPLPDPAAQQRASGSFASGRVAAIALAAFVAGGASVFLVNALSFGSVGIAGRPGGEVAAFSGDRNFAWRAYEAHRTFATDTLHPVEVPASDEPHLRKWLQHRLAMALRIPDLRRQGWTLVGGRILPGEVGPAAFLTYGNGADRIGLYVARTGAQQSDGLMVYDNGKRLGSVGYWVDEPVGYALTTSHDASWLDQDGTQLYQSIKVQSRDSASAY